MKSLVKDGLVTEVQLRGQLDHQISHPVIFSLWEERSESVFEASHDERRHATKNYVKELQM